MKGARRSSEKKLSYSDCFITFALIFSLCTEFSAGEKCAAKSPREQRRLAEGYLKSGTNLMQAVTCLREALSRVEKDGDIQEKGELQGLLIDALDAAGDSSASEKLIRKMMNEFPNSPIPFFKLANHYRAKEKWDEAVKYYRKALDKHPTFTNARTNLAMTYRGMRKFDDSIATYREALLEAPERADIHVNFGVVLDAAGKVVKIT